MQNFLEKFKLDFTFVILLSIMLPVVSCQPNNDNGKPKVTDNEIFQEKVINIPGCGTFYKTNGRLMQYPTYGGNG